MPGHTDIRRALYLWPEAGDDGGGGYGEPPGTDCFGVCPVQAGVYGGYGESQAVRGGEGICIKKIGCWRLL